MKKRTEKTPVDHAARTYALQILIGKEAVQMRDRLDRLDWLLKFSQRPTAEIFALADGPLNMVRGEMMAFAGHYAPAWMSGASIAEMTPDEIADLRTLTAQALKDFLSPDGTGWTTPPLPPAPLNIQRSANGRTHVVYSLNLKAAFISTVASLLEAEGERLGYCPRPGCGRIFARRKRGMFCSTKCAGLVRTQRFNARQQEK
jgi:hypothetical protein